MRLRKKKVWGVTIVILLIITILFLSSVASSYEPFENKIIKETRERFLTKDIPETYIFHSPELPVRQIKVTTNINSGWTSVQVELLNKTSQSVDAPPEVYFMNFNIWIGSDDFAVRNIQEATIWFKVNNTWLTDHGVSANDVSLMQRSVSTWHFLETKKVDVDKNFTYFEAKTTSFTSFVIAGRGFEQHPVTIKESIPGTPARGMAPSSAPSSFNFLGLMAIIGALATVIAAKIAASRRQKEK